MQLLHWAMRAVCAAPELGTCKSRNLSTSSTCTIATRLAAIDIVREAEGFSVPNGRPWSGWLRTVGRIAGQAGRGRRLHSLIQRSERRPDALVAGSNGEVYLAGESRIPLDEASGTGGQWRAWVARLDADGAVLRQVYLGSGGNQAATAIARDAQGTIYLAGNNEDMNAFPPLAPLANGYQGGGGESFLIGFVAQLSATLEVRYASQIAGTTAYALAVDSTGTVYVPTYRSYPDGGVVTVAPNGAGWGPELALGDGLVSASAAAIDANDTLYLAGYGAFARIGAPPPQSPVLQQPLAPAPPLHTVSYYQQSVNQGVTQRQGCQSRLRGEQGIVILDYGKPASSSTEILGTSPVKPAPELGLPLPPAFVSIAEIEAAAQAFVDGYYQVQSCTGVQSSGSTTRTQADLVIALGTTNAPLNGSSNPALSFNHGAAWADMVLRLNNYIAQRSYKGVRFDGAYDAEPRWAEFTGKTSTLNWARGFASRDVYFVNGQPYSHGVSYYNFGSIDGGPRDNSWLGQGSNKNLDFVYELSRGVAVARSIPQVYNAAYAKEWYQLRIYSRVRKGRPVVLSGTLTECATSGGCTKNFAELQKQSWPLYRLDLTNLPTDDPDVPQPEIVDFAPRQGWLAMWDTLHRSLFQPTTLTASLRPTDGFVFTPNRTPQNVEGFRCKPFIIIYYPDKKLIEPNNRYAPDGFVNPNDSSQGPFSSCLPTGAVFPESSTFSSQFALPVGTPSLFTTLTAQELPWSTDIAWGKQR